MTPLLVDLIRHGIRLRVVDGRLGYDGPAGDVPAALVDRIRAAKPDLLRLLGGPVQFATSDADADAGLPVYGPADQPLPAAETPRQAGIDVLILAYACRRRIRNWLDVAGGAPLDTDVLADVTADLGGALKMLKVTEQNNLDKRQVRR